MIGDGVSVGAAGRRGRSVAERGAAAGHSTGGCAPHGTSGPSWWLDAEELCFAAVSADVAARAPVRELVIRRARALKGDRARLGGDDVRYGEQLRAGRGEGVAALELLRHAQGDLREPTRA